MEIAIDDQDNISRPAPPKLSTWLWSPWYAKLWWMAIPIWWMGTAVSARVDALETFYRGALAGYLNVLFFPMTALMVLGVGYLRERFDNFVGQGGGVPLFDEETEAERQRVWEEHERMVKRSRAFADPSDPRSGPFWIGNPLNPLNPCYNDPHSGKHR